MKPSVLALGLIMPISGAWAQPRPAASPARAVAATMLSDSLEALERKSWDAWQRRDSLFFRQFLSDDHVEVGFAGPADKRSVLAVVGGSQCVVKSYMLDAFAVRQMTSDMAVITYHAAQETTCGGRKVPSPVWVASTFIKRGGRWLNAVYQQTQAQER